MDFIQVACIKLVSYFCNIDGGTMIDDTFISSIPI